MPRVGLDSEAVVIAAAELADAEGLEAVTLSRLASRLGVRAPSLYAHVGGVEDLRRRLAARGAQQLRAALQDAAAGRARRDALIAVATAYRVYACEHPGTYTALQREPASEEASRLVDVVLTVLRGYELGGDDAIHAARIVRAALHGFVELEVAGGFRIALALDESFERLVSVLDRGLSSPVS
jgi:AcrR family transcriptional regulator